MKTQGVPPDEKVMEDVFVQLAALVENEHHVCCRYRLRAFRPALEAAGHSLSLVPFPRSTAGWYFLKNRLRHADAVIIQRRLLTRWQLANVRRSSQRLLFDFDDAVFLRDSYAPRGIYSRRRQARFDRLMNACDGVIAGNSFLAKQAASSGCAGAIAVIPSCVDPAHYLTARHEKAGPGVRLTWIGSSSTLKGLELLLPVLEETGQAWPGLTLRLICDRFIELENMHVEKCPWREESEAEDLAESDIGISWLPDDLWSRGKCGVKVLQYMAAGLPVVGNPVGVQAEMIDDGVTGFLARSPLEWSQAIGRLAHDHELRVRMGAAARRRFEKDFSVQRGSQLWLDYLHRLAEVNRAA